MSTHLVHTESAKRLEETVTFGFWMYLMSDCLIFAALFATYGVLHTHTFGGPSAQELFSLTFVLVETVLLLTSSFTMGLAMLSAHHKRAHETAFWMAASFLLGLVFLGMELSEFSNLIAEGHGPQMSAFLSSFFTLVGTHGLHVALGALWMVVLFAQVLYYGITAVTMRRLLCLSLFWHFLDIVWIFIFTFVYLLGTLS